MRLDVRLLLHLGKYQLAMVCLIIGTTVSTWAHATTTAETGRAIGTIVEHLASADEATRKTSMRQFMQYGQSATPYLVGIREYGSPAQRRGAIIGMALLPIPALTMDHLIEGLADEDPATRSLSAHTLAMIGSEAAPSLTAALAFENPLVRNAAAYSLKLMGKAAVPSLTAALDTDDIYVRSKAAWLLGRFGKDALSAVPALIRSLNCEDVRVMHVVAEAIDLIGPDPALAYYHCMLIGNPPGNPVLKIGTQAAPTLTRLLSRPGTPLAQIAFRALASIGQEALPPLKEAMLSGTPSQRTAAALLLVGIDPAMVHTLPDDIRSTLNGLRPPNNQ